MTGAIFGQLLLSHIHTFTLGCTVTPRSFKYNGNLTVASSQALTQHIPEMLHFTDFER